MAYSYSQQFSVSSIDEYNEICKTNLYKIEIAGRSINIKLKSKPKILNVLPNGLITIRIKSDEIDNRTDECFVMQRQAEISHTFFKNKDYVLTKIKDKISSISTQNLIDIIENGFSDEIKEEWITLLKQTLKNRDEAVEGLKLYIDKSPKG